ncbi:hypothetical protein BJY17_002811 [Agromyces hippuratus]|uniref:Uncharacterized protein n=1 Tax=Agromyces hippuratus TaxID=286438 RepID=A0A852X3J5_9MICO|nr:DUF2797 domain-containing protein [Agromyces hippuratus]NYG22064.1 hypothetical protein [Agromyces hippuratus]
MSERAGPILINGMHGYGDMIGVSIDSLQRKPDVSKVEKWSPHLVYIINIMDEGLHKVGVTRSTTGRLSRLATGTRRVVEVIEVANRPVAQLLEATVLVLRGSKRERATTIRHLRGVTECWREDGDVPSLAKLERSLYELWEAPPNWHLSVRS